MSYHSRWQAANGSRLVVTLDEEMGNDWARSDSPKSNRGWFQRGDERINREGPPRKIPLAHGFAKQSDRLKLLVIPVQSLLSRLTRQIHPWIVNLPDDVTIVDAYLDATGNDVIFVVRSRVFPQIRRGSAIPRFTPQFDKLKW
jgi:hypothetical protein